MDTREKVVKTAKEWLGTPWKHNHRTKGFGIDCVNLLGVCAEEVGMEIDFPKVYDRIPKYSSLHLSIERYYTVTTLILPGDIHLFGVNGDNNHVGLAINSTQFIHACYRSNNRGKVQVDRLEDFFWMSKLRKTYDLLSYKGVEAWSGG